MLVLKPYADELKRSLCESLRLISNVRLIESLEEFKFEKIEENDIIVDGIFGFSYTPPLRPELRPLFSALSSTKVPIFSIDVPSGWHVDDPNTEKLFSPKANVSLTGVKPCMKGFEGEHYLSTFFVPSEVYKEAGAEEPDVGDRSGLFVKLS